MLARFILHSLLLCCLANLNSTHFEENTAIAAAQAQHRPIVAAFVGEECPWSEKLKQNVLHSPIFLAKVNAEAVLWINSLKQNEKESAFLQKYQVTQCPLFLLLDPQGKEFARLEYSPLDAEGYAATILSLIADFQAICDALDEETEDFEEQRWQELYRKAKKMSVPCFQQVILEQGINNEEGHFFHLEKFASLLEKHKAKHPLVREAKHQLLSRDPENQKGLHFKAAMLEFQQNAARFKSNDSLEKALKPLSKYIRRFEKKDPENHWKSEWTMAEFLFTHGSIASAIVHAEIALSASPPSVRPQIAETILFMKEKLK
jgi:thioredoxin-related protein